MSSSLKRLLLSRRYWFWLCVGCKMVSSFLYALNSRCRLPPSFMPRAAAAKGGPVALYTSHFYRHTSCACEGLLVSPGRRRRLCQGLFPSLRCRLFAANFIISSNSKINNCLSGTVRTHIRRRSRELCHARRRGAGRRAQGRSWRCRVPFAVSCILDLSFLFRIIF
jgi:hypothetical protein